MMQHPTKRFQQPAYRIVPVIIHIENVAAYPEATIAHTKDATVQMEVVIVHEEV